MKLFLVETFSQGTLAPWYVTGFVEGHGTFTFSRGFRTLGLYFAVKTTGANRSVLEALAQHFGAGALYGSKAAPYYRITKVQDLAKVVSHFDEFPLQTSKRRSYAVWREMVVEKLNFRRAKPDVLEALASKLTALASPRGGRRGARRRASP